LRRYFYLPVVASLVLALHLKRWITHQKEVSLFLSLSLSLLSFPTLGTTQWQPQPCHCFDEKKGKDWIGRRWGRGERRREGGKEGGRGRERGREEGGYRLLRLTLGWRCLLQPGGVGDRVGQRKNTTKILKNKKS